MLTILFLYAIALNLHQAFNYIIFVCFFKKYILLFREVLDLQKNWDNSKESSHICCAQNYLMSTIVHDYGMFVKQLVNQCWYMIIS